MASRSSGMNPRALGTNPRARAARAAYDSFVAQLRSPLVDDLDAWHRIQHELRRAVGDSTWHIWLEPLKLAAVHRDGRLVLEAPDGVRPWVNGRFARVIRACVAAVVGDGVEYMLVAPGEYAINEQAVAA